MRIAIATTVVIFVLAAGCGAGQKESGENRSAEQSEGALQEESANENRDQSPAAPAGQISRSDMNRVLAAGPAALLAQVLTDPVRENGRFVGFRILEFRDGQPASIDLKAGDVILLVNGRKIERPENYFQIFEELRVASELRFKILRGGEELEFSYPIVD